MSDYSNLVKPCSLVCFLQNVLYSANRHLFSFANIDDFVKLCEVSVFREVVFPKDWFFSDSGP